VSLHYHVKHKDAGGIFEDKLQKEKTGHVNNKDLKNRKHDQDMRPAD